MSFEYKFTVLDPAYGNRISRRRIRIERRGGTIAAGLEDFLHACKLMMTLDGKVITAIEGTWYRHPNLTCRGATAQLTQYIGKQITSDRLVLRDYADPRQQCTHFHDLLALAMRHALRGDKSRQYDVAIPDMQTGTTWAEVRLNGIELHRWQIDNDSILSPDALKGRPLEKGFNRWAGETFSGDELEAAHVLQMAVFVAGAANLDFKAMSAKFPGVVLSPPRLSGACYALQPERNHEALPCHEVHDFTDAADQMVNFL